MTDVIPSLRSYLESGGLLTGYIGEEVFDTLADCHAGRFDLPSVRQERFERLTSMFRVTQELLRHATPISSAIYTYIDPAEGRAAVDRLPVVGGAF